jgi:hypothetical protein
MNARSGLWSICACYGCLQHVVSAAGVHASRTARRTAPRPPAACSTCRFRHACAPLQQLDASTFAIEAPEVGAMVLPLPTTTDEQVRAAGAGAHGSGTPGRKRASGLRRRQKHPLPRSAYSPLSRRLDGLPQPLLCAQPGPAAAFKHGARPSPACQAPPHRFQHPLRPHGTPCSPMQPHEALCNPSSQVAQFQAEYQSAFSGASQEELESAKCRCACRKGRGGGGHCSDERALSRRGTGCAASADAAVPVGGTSSRSAASGSWGGLGPLAPLLPMPSALHLTLGPASTPMPAPAGSSGLWSTTPRAARTCNAAWTWRRLRLTRMSCRTTRSGSSSICLQVLGTGGSSSRTEGGGAQGSRGVHACRLRCRAAAASQGRTGCMPGQAAVAAAR